jgi:pimeloyl-ACP methyl ester carboxylesterase
VTPGAAAVAHKGCALAYCVEGAGPAVLLIQGVGVHGEGWRPQIDGLASRYCCLAFDNRGMGRSQPLGGVRISVEQMVEDALVLMDAQGWTSAHVIGHSLGGVVAQHLALVARDRVRSLSLLCTVARGRDATRLSWAMLWTGLRTRCGTRRQRRRAFLELVLPPAAIATSDLDAMAARLESLFGHDLADSPSIAMRQLGALRAYDATPRLAELAGVPTLVVSAVHDRIAPPEAGRRLAAAIPGARYEAFADAAHGLPIHCAERVNAVLLEHLARADHGRRDRVLAGSRQPFPSPHPRILPER